MQVYFIDNEDFFQRKATVSDEKGNGFKDNDRAISLNLKDIKQ